MLSRLSVQEYGSAWLRLVAFMLALVLVSWRFILVLDSKKKSLNTL